MSRGIFFVVLVALSVLPAGFASAAAPQGIFAWLNRVEIDASDDPDSVVLWGAFAFAGDDQKTDTYPTRAVGYLRFTCTNDRHICQDEWRQLAQIAKTPACAGFGVRMLPLPTVYTDGVGSGKAQLYPVAFGVVAATAGPGADGGICPKLKALAAGSIMDAGTVVHAADAGVRTADGGVDMSAVLSDSAVPVQNADRAVEFDASAEPPPAPPKRTPKKRIADDTETEDSSGCRCTLGSAGRRRSSSNALFWLTTAALLGLRLNRRRP